MCDGHPCQIESSLLPFGTRLAAAGYDASFCGSKILMAAPSATSGSTLSGCAFGGAGSRRSVRSDASLWIASPRTGDQPPAALAYDYIWMSAAPSRQRRPLRCAGQGGSAQSGG